jgi:cytoskeletal protein CcmA (bactofilin family)
MAKFEGIINSMVGEGAFFKGDITLEGSFRIDGAFSGSIKTRGRVFVSEEGRAECAIEARSVTVGGIVKGDIKASEEVSILKGGVIIGDVYAPKLNAEDEVSLNGKFIVSGQAPRDHARP